MAYVHRSKVRFAHVDAAGIVFYPRYFELLNGAVEDWFGERLGSDFRTLHLAERIGTPTVRIEAEFRSPGMLGDTLAISLVPARVGESSCTVTFRIATGERALMLGTLVLVCMDLDRHKAAPWPAPIRAAMLAEIASDRDDRVA